MYLFTKNQAEILAVLLSQPDKDYNLSELGKIIEKHPGVFQKGINSLEKQGVITSKKRGNQRLFKINRGNPFYDEIKNIVQKSIGIEGLLKDLVGRIEGIKTAILYGSYVGNKMRSDSDIDLIIVVKNEDAEDILLDKLNAVEKKIQRDINYKMYTEREFNLKIKNRNPFLKEVLSGKYIVIKGKITK